MAQRTTSKGGAGKAASKASVREAASNGPVGDGIDPRRKAALDSALEQVEKSFGKGSAMRLGDKPEQNVEVIPTGSLALDLALGIGGLPKGRIVEIYGPESSGKTTLALHVVANAQKNGGVAAFIDAEHALDPVYARHLGVDTDSLIVSQPDNGEQALEIADMLIRSGALDVIVIDSVAALVPKAEIEGDMGDSHVGLQARLMSQALRKMTGALAQAGTTAIFINQLREKIGVFFGNPETTTGGKALKFYASVRLDIRRIQTIKNGEEAVGNRTKVKVVKNKMLRRSSPPSSMCCMARASPRRDPSWTWHCSATWSRSPAHGSRMTGTSSARAVRTCASSSRTIRRSPRRSATRSRRNSASSKCPISWPTVSPRRTGMPLKRRRRMARPLPPHRLPHDQRRSVPRRSWNM